VASSVISAPRRNNSAHLLRAVRSSCPVEFTFDPTICRPHQIGLGRQEGRNSVCEFSLRAPICSFFARRDGLLRFARNDGCASVSASYTTFCFGSPLNQASMPSTIRVPPGSLRYARPNRASVKLRAARRAAPF